MGPGSHAKGPFGANVCVGGIDSAKSGRSSIIHSLTHSFTHSFMLVRSWDRPTVVSNRRPPSDG